MAGYLVTNAQPRGYALGFKDESRGKKTPERITTPQFYPLMFPLAQRTYDVPIIISGNGEEVLGTETFKKGSAFYTHQNAFIKKLLKKSNQLIVETVKLPGSAKAFLRVSVEVVPTDIPVYQRVNDENNGRIGEYLVDEYGSYIQTGTIVGSKLVHHVGVGAYSSTQKEYGKARIRAGRNAGTTINGKLISSITVGDAVNGELVIGTQRTNTSGGILEVVATIAEGTSTLVDLIVNGENVRTAIRLNADNPQIAFDVNAGDTFTLAYTNGAPAQAPGPLTTRETPKVSAATTIYPIMDIELTAYGSFGNLSGLAILSPTTQDDNPPFLTDYKQNRAVSYRFMSFRKEDANSSAEPVFLLTSDQALDATLKLETISSLSKNPISLATTLVPAYSKKATTSEAAVYGDWGRVKIYEQSLETLLLMLANGYEVAAGNRMVEVEGEGSFDSDPIIERVREDWALLSDPSNSHLINIFSGCDHNAIPYGSFTVSDSVALGGVSFDAGTPQFAQGGSDGIYYYADGRPAIEVNAKIYDDAVRHTIKNFGLGDNKYKDALRYPVSCIIDSGFSLQTKLQLPTILTRRPDMYVIAATHSVYDEGQVADSNVRSIYRDGDAVNVENVQQLAPDWGLCKQQTAMQEDAYGAALKAAFNTTMESEYFSTPVTRAILRGQSGTVIEEDIWDGYLPLTYELMCQLSDFAGDSSGRWRVDFDFTIEPNNVIQLMENINNTYRENNSFSKLWDIGVNWSQSYDQFRNYTPALQTVYPYDDSVLNSAKMMMACCRLEYLNVIVHSRLTGRDDLTDDEFIAVTKRIAEEEAEGIFGGKYIVEAAPEILEGDREKGYIWRNFYKIYGNVMKTAMIYGVIAKRKSDFTGNGQ